MSWINKSIDNYYQWLRNKTFVCEDSQTGWTTITTPFIGLFNDSIEIYAKLENNKLLLSDDGRTLKNLDLMGASVTRSPKRKEWLEMILLNYGVLLEGSELQIEGTENDFNQKKHNLLSSISEISDMAMMAKHTVASMFKEDVRNFLDEQQIIYTPQFIAKGTTGLEFTFDFQIAGKNQELVIKSFNSLSKMNVPNFLFSWQDIRETRQNISGKTLKSLAIVNDIDKEIEPKYIQALKSKEADVVLWKERHQPTMIQKLAA